MRCPDKREISVFNLPPPSFPAPMPHAQPRKAHLEPSEGESESHESTAGSSEISLATGIAPNNDSEDLL